MERPPDHSVRRDESSREDQVAVVCSVVQAGQADQGELHRFRGEVYDCFTARAGGPGSSLPRSLVGGSLAGGRSKCQTTTAGTAQAALAASGTSSSSDQGHSRQSLTVSSVGGGAGGGRSWPDRCGSSQRRTSSPAGSAARRKSPTLCR